MAPGGPELPDRLVAGLELQGKRLLDIGSGLGGPSCHLAEKHGAIVTGVDIEPQLVEISNRRALRRGLAEQVEFRLVEPGSLPFADNSFDVVFGRDSMIHIEDKPALFREVMRVLRPGGIFAASDWPAKARQQWQRWIVTGRLGTCHLPWPTQPKWKPS